MDKRRRQILTFILVVSLVALGILGFVALLTGGMERPVDGLIRFEIQGSQELELPEPGNYVVFLEGSNQDPSLITVQVLDSDNTILELTEPRLAGGYSFKGLQGTALFEFNLEEAGTYRFVVDAPQGSISLALGNNYYREMVVSILGSVVILALALLILGVLAFRQLRKGFEKLIEKYAKD